MPQVNISSEQIGSLIHYKWIEVEEEAKKRSRASIEKIEKDLATIKELQKAKDSVPTDDTY